MEAPLSGSNDVLHNRISNMDQAAQCEGKLFLISEDRLKILASLAKQVFQMCEEFYKVESKPSESTSHHHWSATEEMMENEHIGDVKTSAAVTNPVSHEIILPTSRIERLGETTENIPETSIDNHNTGDFFLDPGGSGDMNDVAKTQLGMIESTSAVKVEDNISSHGSEWQMLQVTGTRDTDRGDNIAFTHTAHNQPEMMESASATEVDNSIFNEGSEWQMPQVKTEQVSDIDPADDVGVSAGTYAQPGMMASSSTMKDEDISAGGSDWQITDVRTEQNTVTDPVKDVGVENVAHTQPGMRESLKAVKDEDISAEGSQWQISNVRTEQNTDAGHMESPVTPPETGLHEVEIVQSQCANVREDTKEESCKYYERTDSGEGFMHQSDPTQQAKTFNEDTSRKCQECGKIYSCNSEVRKHMGTHKGEKPYNCPDCGTTLRRQYHCFRQKSLHTRVRPFKCPDCGKAFIRQHHLQSHMRTHTGEKPYGCRECDKAFSQQSNLRTHMRTHTGEKPFKCQQCGRAFTAKSKLMYHMRRHAEEK